MYVYVVVRCLLRSNFFFFSKKKKKKRDGIKLHSGRINQAESISQQGIFSVPVLRVWRWGSKVPAQGPRVSESQQITWGIYSCCEP